MIAKHSVIRFATRLNSSHMNRAIVNRSSVHSIKKVTKLKASFSAYVLDMFVWNTLEKTMSFTTIMDHYMS